MKKKILITIIALAVSALFSCSATNKTGYITPNIVNIGYNWLSPSEMIIVQGMTIKWENGVNKQHTIISTDDSFRSKPLEEGETFTVRFEEPGIYEYIIDEHLHSKGKIIVQSRGTSQ